MSDRDEWERAVLAETEEAFAAAVLREWGLDGGSAAADPSGEQDLDALASAWLDVGLKATDEHPDGNPAYGATQIRDPSVHQDAWPQPSEPPLLFGVSPGLRRSGAHYVVARRETGS